MLLCRALRSARGAPRSAPARGVSALQHQALLDSSAHFPSTRATKIICTLGPASLPRLPELIAVGMNVARINCAHGNEEQYKSAVAAVRAAEAVVRARTSGGEQLCGSRHDVVAIAFDIKGPEIRVGRFNSSVPQAVIPNSGLLGQRELPLRKGDKLTLTTDPAAALEGTRERLYISYPGLPAQAYPGSIIFVDDGNVELRVLSTDVGRGELLVEAMTDAPLGERKNVNLPGIEVNLPAVSQKDRVDIATANALGADIIFASFVQSAAAVREVRALCAPGMRIISKIESQAGLDRYDEILSASDGIMVARGDLGVQIPAENVVIAQKMMIARANVRGKPVICATQMLDSMVHNLRPTRAEVVDVASAVLDGADAVMLSGETAKGAHPLEAVMTMSRTCIAAESAFPSRAFFTSLSQHPDVPIGVEKDEAFALHEARATATRAAASASADFMTISDVETLASSAVHAAFEAKASAIVVLSLSGRTAAAVAKYRPAIPVLCFVADAAVARSLQLTRGVHAILVRASELEGLGSPRSVPRMRALALRLVKEWGLVKRDDRVVLMCGEGTEMTEGLAVTVTKVH